MTRTQVTAAIALLNKVLPDLKSAELKTDETTTYVIRVPEESESTEAWLRDYVPGSIERAGAL